MIDKDLDLVASSKRYLHWESRDGGIFERTSEKIPHYSPAITVSHFELRTLESNQTLTADDRPDGNAFGNSSIMLLAIVASLVVLLYAFCIIHTCRVWVWGKLRATLTGHQNAPDSADDDAASENGDDTLLVHEGVVHYLNERQRRAVLEAIFSEASKAVTDKDVAEAKQRRKEKKAAAAAADDVPLDVEIPGVSTANTETSSTHGECSPSQATFDEDNETDAEANESLDDTLDESDDDGDDVNENNKDLEANIDNVPKEISEATTLSHSVNLVNDCSAMSYDEDLEIGKRSKALGMGNGGGAKDDAIHRLNALTRTPNAKDTIFTLESAHATPGNNITGLSLSHYATPVAGNVSNKNNAPPGLKTVPVLPVLSTRPRKSSVHLDDSASPEIQDMSLTILEDQDDGMMMPRMNVSRSRLVIPEGLAETALAVNGCGGVAASAMREETKEEIVEDRKPTATDLVDSFPAHIEPVGENLDDDDDGNDGNFLNVCPTMPPPVELLRRESFGTVASEYTFGDDSTIGDNVCPICLCSYKKGEILISSKHCVHQYHKRCIFDWLDQHSECPLCRVSMVTDKEMSVAATNLVGKTRMYQAVALYNQQQRNHRYNNYSSSPRQNSWGWAATRPPNIQPFGGR